MVESSFAENIPVPNRESPAWDLYVRLVRDVTRLAPDLEVVIAIEWPGCVVRTRSVAAAKAQLWRAQKRVGSAERLVTSRVSVHAVSGAASASVIGDLYRADAADRPALVTVRARDAEWGARVAAAIRAALAADAYPPEVVPRRWTSYRKTAAAALAGILLAFEAAERLPPAVKSFRAALRGTPNPILVPFGRLNIDDGRFAYRIVTNVCKFTPGSALRTCKVVFEITNIGADLVPPLRMFTVVVAGEPIPEIAATGPAFDAVIYHGHSALGEITFDVPVDLAFEVRTRSAADAAELVFDLDRAERRWDTIAAPAPLAEDGP